MENKKTGRQIWIDLIKDLVGFERGYYYTLRAVYLHPAEVFDSYFSNKGKYLSPFTLVGISLTIYYLISGFLLDWDAIASTLKHFFKVFAEWEFNLLSDQSDEVKRTLLEKANSKVLSPMVDGVVLAVSKYLILIVFPVQILVFYTTSFFSKKLGFGFYHHLISFNYYFSFLLLFYDFAIVIAILNFWVFVAVVLLFSYFFYGHFFKSYGESKNQIKKAFMKGYIIAFMAFVILAGFIGFIWGTHL